MAYFFALLSVVIVSLVSLIGVITLSINESVVRKYIFLFVSLAVGALLGDAFIHLIPEALETSSDPLLISLLIITGILIFFVLEEFLHWHHHSDDIEKHHIQPVGNLVLFSDGVHNFIDGIIIGASFLVNIPVGIATTMAVILHEIPQEIGDFAVLLHAGYTRKKALRINFMSGLTAVVGTIVSFMLQGSVEGFTSLVLPIAAGGFIYISIADLIPELHKTKKLNHSLYQLVALLLGIVLMVSLIYLE